MFQACDCGNRVVAGFALFSRTLARCAVLPPVVSSIQFVHSCRVTHWTRHRYGSRHFKGSKVILSVAPVSTCLLSTNSCTSKKFFALQSRKNKNRSPVQKKENVALPAETIHFVPPAQIKNRPSSRNEKCRPSSTNILFSPLQLMKIKRLQQKTISLFCQKKIFAPQAETKNVAPPAEAGTTKCRPPPNKKSLLSAEMILSPLQQKTISLLRQKKIGALQQTTPAEKTFVRLLDGRLRGAPSLVVAPVAAHDGMDQAAAQFLLHQAFLARAVEEDARAGRAGPAGRLDAGGRPREGPGRCRPSQDSSGLGRALSRGESRRSVV